MNTIIRPVLPTDRAQVIRCIAALQDAGRRLDPRLRPGRSMAPAYYAQLRRRCVRWRGTILVAEHGGRVVGFVAVMTAVPFTELDEPAGTYALVTDLFVVAPLRRQGLGRRLLAQAERHARRQGATDLRIGVFRENVGARQLYRTAGFQPWVQFLRKRLRAA